MVRRLLRYLVSDADRRAIEHDLDELYQLRLRHDGPRAAARWLRAGYFFSLGPNRRRGVTSRKRADRAHVKLSARRRGQPAIRGDSS